MKRRTTRISSRRPSTFVSRKGFDGIARREKLNAILRVHDLEKPLRTTLSFDEKDWAILRQIAQEGAMTNVGSASRYAAILYLGKSLTAENLNLLTELSQHGEDFYVRGHALLALSTTGLKMAGQVLAAGLDATERLERLAAERGLTVLARQHGIAALRDILHDKRWKVALVRIEQAIARAPRRHRRKRFTTVRA